MFENLKIGEKVFKKTKIVYFKSNLLLIVPSPCAFRISYQEVDIRDARRECEES